MLAGVFNGIVSMQFEKKQDRQPMCGIYGLAYTAPERRSEAPILDAMAHAMIHRGPDEAGRLLRDSVGLGMRRLMIIDLATGQQPIFNEDGSIGIVYNGEVYNFLALRQELAALGHQFRTQSDTEVIVHAYEEYGLDCVQRFNGMFSFALWDSREQRLVLARDHAGQKPLFYHLTDERLAFASEIKSLLQAGDIPRVVNPRAIYHYLSLQYVPGPETILEGVMQLPAGHVAVWQAGKLTVQRYWQPRYVPKRIQSAEAWREEVRRTVSEAVQRHMISEVPLGAFLSGGVDSSIIVALMAQQHHSVKTFSIGFDIPEYSELDHAKRIADHFQTEHHPFVISEQEAINSLSDVVWYSDQPLADTSALATYHLARLTRQHVTVALSGDGGDEAFAGYTRYLLDRLLRVYRWLPEWVRLRLVPALARRLGEQSHIPTDRNIVTGIKRLAQASSTSPKASILAWGSFFSEDQKRQLAQADWLATAAQSSSESLLAAVYDRAQAESVLDRTLAVDFETYLADDLLVKSDRMAMAHSLEARAPFLDQEVLTMAQRIPDHLRIQGRTQKAILRQAFAEFLPKENTHRIKRGFGMPVSAWLRREMHGFARETLLSTKASARGYFQPAQVADLLARHDSGAEDHGQRIWALLVLELWHQHYID